MYKCLVSTFVFFFKKLKIYLNYEDRDKFYHLTVKLIKILSKRMKKLLHFYNVRKWKIQKYFRRKIITSLIGSFLFPENKTSQLKTIFSRLQIEKSGKAMKRLNAQLNPRNVSSSSPPIPCLFLPPMMRSLPTRENDRNDRVVISCWTKVQQYLSCIFRIRTRSESLGGWKPQIRFLPIQRCLRATLSISVIVRCVRLNSAEDSEVQSVLQRVLFFGVMFMILICPSMKLRTGWVELAFKDFCSRCSSFNER